MRSAAEIERIRAVAHVKGHTGNGAEDVTEIVDGRVQVRDRAIPVAVGPQQVGELAALDRRRIPRVQRIEQTAQLPAARAALPPDVVPSLAMTTVGRGRGCAGAAPLTSPATNSAYSGALSARAVVASSASQKFVATRNPCV